MSGDRGVVSPSASALEAALDTERSIVFARWAGVAFGILQVTTYDTMPYPFGVQEAAFGLVAVLALGNLSIWASIGQVTTPRGAWRLSLTNMAFDVGIVSGFVWLWAFDPDSVLFLLLFILPVEAAWRFQLRGAFLVWGAATGIYAAREVYASQVYGFEFSIVSINFRMGVLLIVTIIVGLMARNLDRRTHELEVALDEIQAVNDWRARLVDMLAHDLRSPLGNVVSTLETLHERDELLDDRQRTRLRRSSLNSARRVLRLTDDLLALARVSQGRLALTRREVDVGETLRGLIAELDAETQVELDVPDGLVVRIDPMRFGQIVTNLVSNAMRHGRPPVEVYAWSDEAEGVVIEVSDAGAGIDEEHRRMLFAPFTQGTRSDSVGLGLWIVRTLAEAHGGSVVYEERDDRICFVVHLPASDNSAETELGRVAARPDSEEPQPV